MDFFNLLDAWDLAILLKVIQVKLNPAVFDPRFPSLFVILESLLFKDVFEVLSDLEGGLEPFSDREVQIAVLYWREVDVLLDQLHLLVFVLRE